MAVQNVRRKLTNHDLERVFNVTTMTLYLWRQGTKTKSKLRTTRGKGRAVTYYEDDVLAWAKKHNVPIVVHPTELQVSARKRPGPKPRLLEAA